MMYKVTCSLFILLVFHAFSTLSGMESKTGEEKVFSEFKSFEFELDPLELKQALEYLQDTNQSVINETATHNQKNVWCIWQDCNQSFETKEELQKHWVKDHSHINNGWYECRLHTCHFRNKSFHDWTRHVLKHTEYKKFLCKKCNKDFTQKCNLKTHLKGNHEYSEEEANFLLCEWGYQKPKKNAKKRKKRKIVYTPHACKISRQQQAHNIPPQIYVPSFEVDEILEAGTTNNLELCTFNPEDFFSFSINK